jgi:WD40 repeat protein
MVTDGEGRPWLYDAFVSYSHASDNRLAPALQRCLERLTRPWYRRRALRVFRDQSNLAANSDLWGTIDETLRASHYLILLASPEAARSDGIKHEVEYWRKHREPATFLIALTAGTIRWDNATGDFDWTHTDAVPGELRGWFTAEPLWEDLTWARDETHLPLGHPRFRDVAGTLAAAIRGIPKDELDSEDMRQHRIATWVGRAVVSVLAVLLVISASFAHIANQQREVADQQRTVAEQQRTVAEQQREVATVRALEADSVALRDTDPQSSLEDNLAALRIAPSAQIRDDLVTTLLDSYYAGRSPAEDPEYYSDSAAAFGPENRLLATQAGSNDDVDLWNVANPIRPVHVATLTDRAPTDAEVTALAFSPDGKTLAVSSDDDTMMLWDIVRSPRLLATLTMTGYTGEGIAFSPDGRTLATGWNRASDNGDTLILWDVSDPARPVRLATRTGTDAEQLAFSPDGRLLAGSTSLIEGDNSGVVTRRSGSTLWDVSDAADPQQLAPRLLLADGALAFSPDGRTLAISDGSFHVQLWDFADPSMPKRIATLVGHTDQVNALAFSPDGRTLASGSMDDDVILWNTSDLNKVTRMATLAGDPTVIDAVAFTQDGRYLLTDDDDIRVDRWSAVPHQPFVAATLTGHTGAVESVAISPDNQILATGGFDRTVMLWNIADPERPVRLARLAGFGGEVTALTFSPDGKTLVTGSDDRRMVLWDVSDPAHPHEVASVRCPGGFTSVAFSRGGTLLVAGGYPVAQGLPNLFAAGWAALWQVSGHDRPSALASFTNVGTVSGPALSSDGKILVLPDSVAGTMVWNVTDPTHPVRLPDPDGSLPVTDELNFSDMTTFSPDGTAAATTADSGSGSVGPADAELWSFSEPAHVQPLVTLSGPKQQIESLAFHPSGNLLAAASEDFTTTVWDVADRVQPFEVERLSADTDAVNDAVFSPNGRLLVTGSSDFTTVIWDLAELPSIVADPVTMACQITGGGMTPAQWASHASGVPYQRSCP